MDRKSRFWAALSIIGIAAGADHATPYKKSPAETGLRAELEGIGRTPKRARNNRLPRHCGKKMPRFEAGLRRVSQHGVFRSAPPGQPAKAATVPALRAGRIRQ
jgi:hypothetical protein